jgi:hypothetical protein
MLTIEPKIVDKFEACSDHIVQSLLNICMNVITLLEQDLTKYTN